MILISPETLWIYCLMSVVRERHHSSEILPNESVGFVTSLSHYDSVFGFRTQKGILCMRDLARFIENETGDVGLR